MNIRNGTNRYRRLTAAFSIFAATTLLAFPRAGAGEEEESHEHDHDHGSETTAEVGHSEEGHGNRSGETLELTPEAMEMAGIRIDRAERGRIETSIHIPGEVGFDEDRLVHVVPRFAGVAHDVRFRIGDRVRSGEVLAVLESNESLSQYSISAPITGWIIEKHVTIGEFVSAEDPIYVIADLDRVWVDLAVYLKDADRIQPGQTVQLHAIGSDLVADGIIDYISPVVDPRTRSMTARIVLPNSGNRWRPGMFVHADVLTGRGEERLLVESAAVQVLDEESIVFVPDGEAAFRSVPVSVGKSDERFTEILDGLDAGAEYVSAGAFELKAMIVTSALGAHAGHGH